MKTLNKLLTILPLCAVSVASARDLSADRPDATESPITVEPGLYQIESTLWGFTREGSTSTWTLAETNLKAGLTANTDLQLVLSPWINEEGGAEGFGDADVRLKWNLWGNDGGKTAGALMPFVTVPTFTDVSTGEWQGGLIFPVAIEINDRVGFGFQMQLDRAWNEDDGTHDWDFGHTAVIGYSLTDCVGMFVEYAGSAGDHPYEASLHSGLTYATSENVQWDVAFGVGLTDAADDFSLIQGVSFRF